MKLRKPTACSPPTPHVSLLHCFKTKRINLTDHAVKHYRLDAEIARVNEKLAATDASSLDGGDRHDAMVKPQHTPNTPKTISEESRPE